MSFDYSKLSGKIIEKYGTQYNFARALGISERSLSLKLNSKVFWKNSEIHEVCKLLDISTKDIPKYFFKEKVQFNWT